MLGLRLYILQRMSALFMGPFVLVHIAVMIHAIQGGLSTAEILGHPRQYFLVSVLFYLCDRRVGTLCNRPTCHRA
jgi:fumarate reductase subunit C